MNDNEKIYVDGFSQLPNLDWLREIIYEIKDASDYIPINKLGKNKSKEDLN